LCQTHRNVGKTNNEGNCLKSCHTRLGLFLLNGQAFVNRSFPFARVDKEAAKNDGRADAMEPKGQNLKPTGLIIPYQKFYSFSGNPWTLLLLASPM
jgi:hypothetical protein